MARLVTSGAEWQDDTIDGTRLSTTNIVFDTTNKRSGASCWKVAPTTNTPAYIAYTFLGVTGVTYFTRACIMFAAQVDVPATGTIFRIIDSSSVTLRGIEIRTITSTGVTYGLAGGGGSESTEIPYGVYTRLEISININAGSGADDTYEVRVDGVTLITGTIGLSTLGPGALRVGFITTPGTSKIMYVDDVAINDDQGANQNTWPGEGKVVLLKSVTDNAGGTGWTLGTGTALGGAGHTAVANTPPLGVADLAAGSDVKQIRNASSNANVNYDANMTDYATAGLSQYDTISVVDPIIATAAPVTTSAKQGTVGVVSNPNIANIALSAGGTAGAFWSGVAAGTYPTGWKWSHGTITYSPAVTISTAPVMRITQVTASTRIAMVCAMGIYVEYVPHSRPNSVVRSDAFSRASNW